MPDTIVVRRIPSSQSWVAYRGEKTIGQVRAFLRPDRRCFLFFRDCDDDAFEPLVESVTRDIPGDLFATVEESDERTQRLLHRVDFAVHRREPVYSIPADPAVTQLRSVRRPYGIMFLSAADADEARLMRLDDALRQDVPGTDGWRWPEAADFREATFRDGAYDPATYLVRPGHVPRSRRRHPGGVRWARPSLVEAHVPAPRDDRRLARVSPARHRAGIAGGGSRRRS